MSWLKKLTYWVVRLTNYNNIYSKILMKLIKLFSFLLKENIQQAEKVYFNTGLLSNQDKEKILAITNGDNWTKLVTDVYYKTLLRGTLNIIDIKKFHDHLKKYNKNVFPVKEFNNVDSENIFSLFIGLIIRERIIEIIDNLPAIAKRNVKQEIRKERNEIDLNLLYNKMSKFYSSYRSVLKLKRDDRWQEAMKRQLFKSENTINDWVNYIEKLEQRIMYDQYLDDKDYVKKLIESRKDLTLLKESNDVFLVKVTSQEGIAKIGCNALWCFVKDEFEWLPYSTNNMVYVIIDFSDSPFFVQDYSDDEESGYHVSMAVIINKLDFENEEKNKAIVYDSTNRELVNSIDFIRKTIGIGNARKYITFE